MAVDESLSVLIVDDEPLVRTGLKTILNRLEVHPPVGEILEAEDGYRAIEILKGNRIDLVFTDIVMPRLDGLGLLDWIVRNEQPSQCVVLSCHDDYEYVRESFQHDIVDYLLKYDITEDSVSKIWQQATRRRSEKPSDHQRNSTQRWWDSLASNPDADGLDIAMILRTDGVRIPVVQIESTLTKLLKGDRDTDGGKIHIHRSDDQDTLNIALSSSGTHGKPSRRLDVESLSRKLVEQYKTTVTLVYHGGWSSSRHDSDFWDTAGAVLSDAFYTGPGIYRIDDRTSRPESVPSDFFRIQRIEMYRACQNSEMLMLRQHVESLVRTLKAARPHPVQSVIDLFGEMFDFIVDIHGSTIPADELGELKERRKELERFRYLDDIASFVFDFLAYLDSESIEGLRNSAYSMGIQRTIAYIHAHYHSAQLSLSTVADHLDYSHSYLSRQFKKETGQNLVQYINILRLKEARRLLLTGRYFVYEVSDMVGYNNYNYFSRLYKQIHGCTPNTDLKIVGTLHDD